jgi:23S rRNA pseudouridine1911/1915/1917 synthase
MAAQSPLEHIVDSGADVVRLVDYLKARLVQIPVTEIGDLVTGGFVHLRAGAGVVRGRTADPLRSGDVILLDAARIDELRRSSRWLGPWARQIDVVYEDHAFVVVDKPAGVHVHPIGDRRDRTLVGALVARAMSSAPAATDACDGALWAAWRPHVVQRLDCIVSGLLVVAKDAATKATFVREQKAHRLARGYTALVEGVVAGDSGVVDAPLGREPGRGWRRTIVPIADGGQRAVTRWKVRERGDCCTLLDIELETGRTHQIRVHLASLGHPIVGDRLYGATQDCGSPVTRDGFDAPRASASAVDERLGEVVLPIALHATTLSLRHPDDGRTIFLASPLPERLRLPSSQDGNSVPGIDFP